MLKNSNYICALDIGSSKISAALAVIKKHQIISLHCQTLPIRCMRRGSIVDSIDLVDDIGQLIKNIRTQTGIAVKYVYTNISGADILTKHSRAIIPLAERGNKVITPADIKRVNEQARILGSSLDEETIHQIPSSYSIDTKSNILNPLGLYSHKLEVDLYLVCGKLSAMQSLSRVVNQSGLDIKGLYFSGIATSDVVFNPAQRKGIHVLCDIGKDITEIVLFQEGLLQNIKILPFGGDDFTVELSNELKIPFELAEDVKRSHGFVGDADSISGDKEILVKEERAYKPIKQKRVVEIVTSRSQVLSQAVKEAVECLIPLNQIDSFTVCGRALLLDGFLESFERVIGIPVKLGRLNSSDIVPLASQSDSLSGQHYLTYVTALGIISLALRQERPQLISEAIVPPNLLARSINKVREVYQEYF
ncbi:MAG TPA: cell division protein FtsA [Candidatus Omnitrophota bacterium]|nr:cell division protein FtsA [Candidatus Omnitrophota bacterium]HPT06875.1 cell division protein FtsA [Candidatus Omnitrophota bacterium]